MDDNGSPDDDVKDSSPMSPKMGGKKFKLNDGSSQESFKEAAASSSKEEKDDNVDSGVSADKSESTSSDDRAARTSGGPSNEVVIAAPSSSNVRAILLNISRPKRARNYRKRKTPDRDSDSNESSMDSDDLSPEESNTVDVSMERTSSNDNSNSEAESDDIQRLISPSTGSSSSDSNDTSGTEDMVQIASDDSETEDEDPYWSRPNVENDDEDRENPPSVLLKTRPKHNYLMLKEIINREMGLTFPCSKTSKTDLMFEQKFYGSLHVAYRMEKLHHLNHHKGCVNSINFHPEGHLLASGSDDTNVVVWDWARKVPLQTLRTGHKSNVFQSKFLHLNAQSQLNIVTCARDGQVRLLQCPPSGGSGGTRRRLCSHTRAAHKLHVCCAEPHLVISAGEDGVVLQCDVRREQVSRLFHVRDRGATIPLYSVHGHPLEPRQLCVCGRDKFIRVYDRRKSTKPIAMYCPTSFNDTSNTKKKMRMSMMHLTCAVYNHDGSEILGSYNDEDIYLFDTKKDVYDKDNTNELKDGYQHKYSGHRNSATFKGVAFFGPKSEYIVSGSDCSYIYMWEKKSEAIVQWLQGDVNGVINCIEAHPRFPVLASSGLDKDVKIWIPKSSVDPDYDGIERVVRENSASALRSPLFNDFLPSLYSAWRGAGGRVFADDAPPGNIDFDQNVCTAF